jgi:hypothetical protein
MAYDFGNRAGDTFHFRTAAYGEVLELARDHGWEPAGTVLPKSLADPERPWMGSYFSNSGQIVQVADAHSLAAALDRALEDLRHHGDMFWLRQVAAFARFCRYGAFQIC